MLSTMKIGGRPESMISCQNRARGRKKLGQNAQTQGFVLYMKMFACLKITYEQFSQQGECFE